MRPESREARVLESRILCVGVSPVIFGGAPPAARGNGSRSFDFHRPLDHVNLVRPQVGDLSSGVVPEPAEVVKTAIFVVRTERRRPEPKVIEKSQSLPLPLVLGLLR